MSSNPFEFVKFSTNYMVPLTNEQRRVLFQRGDRFHNNNSPDADIMAIEGVEEFRLQCLVYVVEINVNHDTPETHLAVSNMIRKHLAA